MAFPVFPVSRAARAAMSLALSLGVALTGSLIVAEPSRAAIGAATRLAFTTGPQTIIAGELSSAIRVQLRNEAGSPVTLTTDVVVTLSTTSSGGTFLNAAGTKTITKVRIRAGKSKATFLYRDTVAGSPTITASNPDLISAQQVEQITPAALDHLVVRPASATIEPGGSQAYTVEGVDRFGNSRGDVTASATLSIAPEGSCANASCTASEPGTHTVTATVGSATGTATLEVAGPSVAPTISGFTPGAGPVGTLVTVTGTGFRNVTAVRFGGVDAATYSVASQTELTAEVPFGASTGKISVVNDAGTALSSTTFKVKPTITDFTPKSGVPGDTVVLTGSAFIGATSLRFGSVPTTFVVDSYTQITTTVPDGAVTGKISVTNTAGTGFSATAFKVGPVITGFSPTSGQPGDTVVITGSSLSGATSVEFGTTPATTFTVDSATQVTATVPDGASTGKIRITTPNGVAVSDTSFKIPPTISSFTPDTGTPGTIVTITGTTFTGATSVKFSGVAATFTVDSATQITATVPDGAITGRISVTTPGGTATSSTNFKVPPSISSFTPTSGPVGTVVTITGSGFTPGTNVRFSNFVAAASVTYVSYTELRATVPEGAVTGPITVSNGGGTVRSSTSFQVTSG